MSAAPKPVPATAVAVATTDPLAAQRALHIAEMRERNAFAVAIKGQAWSKDLNGTTVKAVAHYCQIHNLDPAIDVEVLGGRIYHTGECYEKRGMPLVRAGVVTYSEPDWVHHDPRLDELAKSDDADLAAYAKAERARRIKARIDNPIPEDATGACIYRGFVVAENGTRTPVVGFNWCGGKTKIKTKRDGTTYRGDPVGDAEPIKTAQSRAKRRFWRQVVEANPVVAESLATMEASARIVNTELEAIAEAEAAGIGQPRPLAPLLAHGDDPYATGATLDGEPIETAARTREDEAFEMELDK